MEKEEESGYANEYDHEKGQKMIARVSDEAKLVDLSEERGTT